MHRIHKVSQRTLLIWLLCGTGCGGLGVEPGDGVFEVVVNAPNFNEHIQPLMVRYCDSCHADTFDGSDRFVSIRYADGGVYDNRKRIQKRVLWRTPSPMPPAPNAFMSLNDEEVLLRWLENGAPES